jgi:hypothetical protein
MKGKGFLFMLVFFGIAIIIMAINNFQLSRVSPIFLPDSVAGNALFVCPAADTAFDMTAAQVAEFKKPLSIIFMFMALLWVAITGWVLYQSMLLDKFERKNFETPIFLGKFLLFAFVIAMIFMHGPNYYRAVEVAGAEGKWVLCENNSPGARAVRAEAARSPAK